MSEKTGTASEGLLLMVFFYVFPDPVKGAGADNVLDPAGVLLRDVGLHAQRFDQKLLDQRVPLINFPRRLQPLVRQFDEAAFVHRNIILLFQNPHCPADTGLGIIEPVCNIDRTNAAKLLLQDQDRFQIVFAAFAHFFVLLFFIPGPISGTAPAAEPDQSRAPFPLPPPSRTENPRIPRNGSVPCLHSRFLRRIPHPKRAFPSPGSLCNGPRPFFRRNRSKPRISIQT